MHIARLLYSNSRDHWFQFEWLPGYAPELNPVESCWSHVKCHELSNLCVVDVDELASAVVQCLDEERKRSKQERNENPRVRHVHLSIIAKSNYRSQKTHHHNRLHLHLLLQTI